MIKCCVLSFMNGETRVQGSTFSFFCQPDPQPSKIRPILIEIAEKAEVWRSANLRPIHFRKDSMSKRTQDLSHEVTYAGQQIQIRHSDTMNGHKFARTYSTKFFNRMSMTYNVSMAAS
jgi:hypothetical protein